MSREGVACRNGGAPIRCIFVDWNHGRGHADVEAEETAGPSRLHGRGEDGLADDPRELAEVGLRHELRIELYILRGKRQGREHDQKSCEM